MIDTSTARVAVKPIRYEEDGDILFATVPAPKPKPVYVAPVITPENAELARKMQIAGLVGLGWLR
jgi:hypothetical protein